MVYPKPDMLLNPKPQNRCTPTAEELQDVACGHACPEASWRSRKPRDEEFWGPEDLQKRLGIRAHGSRFGGFGNSRVRGLGV